MAEPISEPGWYRILAWEPVAEQAALAEIQAGRGHDLIMIKSPGPGHEYLMSPDQAPAPVTG